MKELSLKTEKPKGKYSKLWSIIHDAGGWDNVLMLEVVKFPCNDAREAESECFIIQQLYRMELLNKQFKADEEKIKLGENVKPKHSVKHH